MFSKLSLNTYAILFGIALIAAGALGFVPAVTPNGMLLGLFMVDPIHNIIHVLSGLFAFAAVYKAGYAQLYFRVFGVIYGLVAILGFALNGDMFMMHMNMADNILHIVIAIASLYLGFAYKPATA